MCIRLSIVSMIFWFFLNVAGVNALECPKQPEQSKTDWDTEVQLAMAKIGFAKGLELKSRVKNATQDLLSKLPKADKLYLEQMMYATYCSALRDDKSLTESEKAKRVKAYNAEVRKTFSNFLSSKKDQNTYDKKKQVAIENKKLDAKKETTSQATQTFGLPSETKTGSLAPKSDTMIKQTMNNSPGGVQVGRDLNINVNQREAESKINTFSSRLAIRFSGNWRQKPYPNSMISPVNDQYYVEIIGSATKENIKFYATATYQFTTIDEKAALFESVQAVRDGEFPLGKEIYALKNLNQIALHIPFINYKEIVDQTVIIQQIDLTFFVNGEQRYKLSIPNQNIVVPIIAPKAPFGWANPLLYLESRALIEWLEKSRAHILIDKKKMREYPMEIIKDSAYLLLFYFTFLSVFVVSYDDLRGKTCRGIQLMTKYH